MEVINGLDKLDHLHTYLHGLYQTTLQGVRLSEPHGDSHLEWSVDVQHLSSNMAQREVADHVLVLNNNNNNNNNKVDKQTLKNANTSAD